MYNKIKELCNKLSAMSDDEMKKEGVDALLIMSINSVGNCFEFAHGDFPTILSMIGTCLAKISKTTGYPLKELIDNIYEAETMLEQLSKEGDIE